MYGTGSDAPSCWPHWRMDATAHWAGLSTVGMMGLRRSSPPHLTHHKAKPERIKLSPNKSTAPQSKGQQELREHRNTQPLDGKILNVWHQSKITRQGMQKSMVHNEEGTQSTETNPELTQMLELAGRTLFQSFNYNCIPCV